jgi:hypothetical protein
VSRVAYPPEFTIAYIVHGDVPLLDRVIPTTLDTLCRGTARSYDLVLVVDGADTAPVGEILPRAHGQWGFDEVRLRWRERHRAGGDPSNNGHAHVLPAKGRYLITVEGDVVAFRTGAGDVLDLIAQTFDACPDLALATRIDDHDCWQWQLEAVGEALAPGVRSVNRVASHFLVYDLERAASRLRAGGGVPADRFHDTADGWFNYEDWLSRTFARPAGPGIGFLDALPVRVFHCDRKTTPGSAHYLRDPETRLGVFEQRRRECSA